MGDISKMVLQAAHRLALCCCPGQVRHIVAANAEKLYEADMDAQQTLETLSKHVPAFLAWASTYTPPSASGAAAGVRGPPVPHAASGRSGASIGSTGGAAGRLGVINTTSGGSGTRGGSSGRVVGAAAGAAGSGGFLDMGCTANKGGWTPGNGKGLVDSQVLQ